MKIIKVLIQNEKEIWTSLFDDFGVLLMMIKKAWTV